MIKINKCRNSRFMAFKSSMDQTESKKNVVFL